MGEPAGDPSLGISTAADSPLFVGEAAEGELIVY